MPVDKRLLVKIAHYYYYQGLTQEQIAVRLSISRQKVNRLVKKLVDEGIVEIKINGLLGSFIDLENQLEQEFNLRQAIVIGQPEDESLIEALGIAGASYLNEVIQSHSTIGVSWGRTLQSVAHHLTNTTEKNISVVQLAGGINPTKACRELDEIFTQSSEITRIFASKLKATPYFMHAPIFVESKEIKDVLMSDPSIQNSFAMLHKCDIAITSIGGIGEHINPFKQGLLSLVDLNHLRQLGSVGNLCFRYFDIDGNDVQTLLNSRIIGPTIVELKKLSLVGIAAGKDKYQAILGALRGGFLNVLITNQETAVYILSASNSMMSTVS